MTSLGFSLAYPWLAGLGLAAISLPIIIHLLNKRRFKIVDWAAMEFLFDADKRNRRRLKLENLILLLLRCLALLLLGLLFSRPFTEGNISLGQNQQYERIILVDDSPSMHAQSNNRSSMDETKQSLESIARGLVDNNAVDSLTIFLTSRPDTPLVNNMRLDADSVEDVVAEILELKPSDKAANIDVAFQELKRYLAAEKDNIDRVLYVMTDLRARDWRMEDGLEDENHPRNTLQRLAKETSASFLVDVGNEEESNLAVTEIVPEDTLVAGVPSRFDVTVSNTGDAPIEDVTVKFTAGDSIPLEAEIVRIEANSTETVQFNFTFSPEDFLGDDGEFKDGHATSSMRVMAQVTTSGNDQQDRLLADSERYFAARVIPGIPTLVVDGDPSAVFGRSESIFLRRALAPPGDTSSGIAVEVVTDTELETVKLEKFQVIFLCNVYQLSESRIQAIEQWTEKGGGLILLPGDQVDEDTFNELMVRKGAGLSPMRLTHLSGDETRREWVNFQIDDSNHPVFQIFGGEKNPFIERAKIFRWWTASVLNTKESATVSVPAKLTDEDESPAVAEKPYGKGRVLAMAIPGDKDWTNWPDDYSFVVAMQELVRYMAGNAAGTGDLEVGEPLRYALDLVEHRESGLLELPDNERINVQAVYSVEEGDKTQTTRQFNYPDANRRGFYQLKLTRTDGGEDQVLFAANIDPSESNLHRLTSASRKKLESEKVEIVSAGEAAAQVVRGSRQEFWWFFLYAAVCVLCVEQVLGWLFGMRR